VHTPRSRQLALTLAIVLATISTVGSAVPPATGVAFAQDAAQPYAGQTVVLWEIKRVNGSDILDPLLKEFTQQTGITVDHQVFPEGGYNDKLTVSQQSKDSSYDVFEGDVAARGQFTERDSVEPLDSYLNDPTATPADWDASDIPDGLMSLCRLNASTLCIPQAGGGTFYYYNKKIFADAGISGPPQSVDEMVADAAKTNSPDHAGICMRGTAESANMFTGFMLSQYFLPYSDSNHAVILDASWHPTLTTPEAVQWGTTYQTLMQQYAPKGIASYGYSECNRDFEAGKVAQYFESDAWTGEFTDPTKSTVADQTGYSVIPCAAVNPDHCMVFAYHGWYINRDSQHKGAAWELMKWINSKDIVTRVSVGGGGFATAIRNSSLDALAATGKYPDDMIQAFKYQKTHAHPSPFPPIPEIFQVVNPVSVALSKIVAGEASPADAMAEANASITDALVQGGELQQ
jgi:multiple sugar transport system substrate-binding protein